MEGQLAFTAEEREQTVALYQQIREQIAPSLHEGDEERIRQLIMTAC